MVDVVQIIATAAALTVVLGGMAAVVVKFRQWVRGLADSANETTKQLATSNGHTIGQYVEQAAGDVTEIRKEISTLGEWASENHALGKQALRAAQEATTLARHAHDRLDAYLAGRKDGDGA